MDRKVKRDTPTCGNDGEKLERQLSLITMAYGSGGGIIEEIMQDHVKNTKGHCLNSDVRN